LQNRPSIARELNKSDPARRKILLIPEILISQHHYVENPIYELKKVTILDARPPLTLHGSDIMVLQKLSRLNRDVFV
jgi:hypothetical protein